ncbi:MAG: hypothetical protein AAF693_01600 [Bacteroidota bacterium]
MSTATYIIWYSSVFSPLIPLVFSFNRLFLYQKVILLFIAISFGTDLFTTFIFKQGNYTILYAYGLVESLILIWFYKIAFGLHKKWFKFIIAVFSSLYLSILFRFELGEFNSYSRSLESLVMIFLCCLLFYRFYSKEEDIFLDKSPLFWFNIAILVYFSGSFFSFLLSKLILKDQLASWAIHNISNIFKNLIIAIGLWKVK